MTVDPRLQILMDELGERMGLGELALDADGSCALKFDGRTVVGLQHRADEDALWLYADLGAPTLGPKVYEDLLRGNLFWRRTDGATLSLSEDETPHVVMALPIAWRGLDGAQLGARLERFLDTVEDWADRVANVRHDNDQNDAPAAGDPSFIVRA